MTALASRPKRSAAPARGAGYVLMPLAVALPAAAGVAATYYVFVRTTLGQQVDSSAMNGGDVSHQRLIEVLDRTLNGTTLISLVLVCLAAATIGVLRKRLDLALGAGLLVLGANASCQLLKTHLSRPDLDGSSMPNSFPSGHTTAAASVAFALIMVLPQAVRGTVTLIGAAYVTVIAVATVWAAWHRPSDTVGALLLVLAWATVAAFAVRLARSRTPGPPGHAGRPATVLLLVAGAIAGAGGLVGLASVALSERASPDLVSGKFAFLTGSAGIAAAVAAVFLVWVRLAAGDPPTTDPTPKKGAKK